MSVGFQSVITFLGILLPLTLSPGPVNISLAGLGSTQGMVSAIPFFTGLTISAAVIAAFGGFGLQQVFTSQPMVYLAVRYAGIAYIFYLAYKFFIHIPVSSNTQDDKKSSLGFMNGLLLTSLNPKFYIMITVVFGQFLRPDNNNLWALVSLFVFVLAASQFVWLFTGKMFKHVLKNSKIMRAESKVFGALLALTAVYMLFAA